MANGPRYRVPFRRRREGRTDYRYRQRLLRARVPRAVVRLSLRNATVQLVSFEPDGDKVLAAAKSTELKKLGWTAPTGNLPSAYLTGYLAGKRAVKSGVEEAVLDIGLKVPAKGSNVFAALKGLLDAGLSIPHGEDVIPSEARLKGEHINAELASLVEQVKGRAEAD